MDGISARSTEITDDTPLEAAERDHEKAPTLMQRLLSRKRWGDLSPAQKAINIVGGFVELTLVTLALWDLWHRPAKAVNGKKVTWVLTTLIQPIGPIIYFIFGRKRTPLTA